MGKTKITIWITNEQLAGLRKVQQDLGVPVSEAIRRGINMYLDAAHKRSGGRRKS